MREEEHDRDAVHERGEQAGHLDVGALQVQVLEDVEFGSAAPSARMPSTYQACAG